MRGEAKFLCAFVVTMVLAALGDFTQPAGAQQTAPDPVPALLAQYNLPPAEWSAAMLDQAASRLATANQGGNGPTSTRAVLEAAVADRRVYVELAPHLIAVAMEAISTRNPTPTQQAFYTHFQRYYADLQQFIAIRMLGAWNEYRGTSVYPETIVLGGQTFPGQIFAPPEVLRPPVAEPIGPISMLIDTGKPVSGFVPPRDVLPMSQDAAGAIAEVFGAMALSEDPSSANHPLAAGGDKTTAALAGLGLGVGVGIVAVGAAFGTVIGTTAGINATIAATIAANAALGNVMYGGAPLALFGAAGAVTVVSSVLVVIPLLVAAGMKIASVVETNNFEAGLVRGASKPDYSVDVRAIVDPVYVQDAGLWYKECAAGHRGVATRCYKDCDTGYVDDGLLCRRPPDSFGKDSYQRGVEVLSCRAGLVNDAGLCYPACQPGWRGVATRCYADCPTGTIPNTRVSVILYRDDGLFCAKGLDYARGAGYVIWEQGSCERDHGVGNCELQGLLWYPKCRPGYHQTTVNFCSQDCPRGWADIGVSCPKPFYDRGVGGPIDTCRDGTERFGALCYPLCQSGYSSPPGLPNTCMSQAPCPAEYTDTGFTCLRNLHVYGKGFYDRGSGTANRPSDQDSEVARKSMFTFLVRMLVGDAADRGQGAAPVQTRSGTACPAGFVAQGGLCGQPIDGKDGLAPTVRLERTTATVDGVHKARWDASGSVAVDGGPVTITWDFGDGVTAVGPIADHDFAKPGNYTVTVTATDTSGRTSSVTAQVAVVAAGPTGLTAAVVEASSEGAATTIRGGFTPGDLGQPYSLAVTWGDGSTETVPLPPGTATFSLSHTYVDNIDAAIGLTVRDAVGQTVATSLPVSVGNELPRVMFAVVGRSTVDTPTVVEGTVVDAGALDGQTLAINWGDGSTTETMALPPGTTRFTASHTYRSTGFYQVVVTATDDDGGIGSTASQVNVSDLTPADRIARVIESLRGTTAPALVIVSRHLDGSNGGRSNDGAIDHLARGNLSSALGRLREAVGAASRPGAPPSAAALVTELTAVARALATGAVANATGATPARVTRALNYIDAGDGDAAAGRAREAVHNYQRAVGAVSN